ncbi:amino acid deaminase [Nocardia yamanashiensis]|uniref:amino acid deaminase n=1 Tax=Nocardia yamanashiensis TaxID=209247 RepID=UPI001E3FEC88|nr:amino acid deaminase [Nocardia yamanashiensis]UGT41220.1 amino acid deaminase [Nocardia yamanashiensis]
MASDNAVAPAPGDLSAFADTVLGPQHKSLPPAAWGLTVREYLATAPHLDDLQTPVLTIDRAALDNNRAVMADWADAAGMKLAPHGKTTMSPQLWREQLEAGSWGITLATGWQAQVGRSFGLNRIMLANALLDPAGIRWAAEEIAADPTFELYSWVDSVASVREMERHLESAPEGVRLSVLVELGGPHGRTGARGLAAAHEVADAVHKSPRLMLAGVGGYEGALAHDRTPAGLATVRQYLDELSILHRELADSGRYDEFVTVPGDVAGASSGDDAVVAGAGDGSESGAGVPRGGSGAPGDVDAGPMRAAADESEQPGRDVRSVCGEAGDPVTEPTRTGATDNDSGRVDAARAGDGHSPSRIVRRSAIVTAGGSAYPDLVVERLGALADEAGAQGVPTTVVLRSGAYLVHDDGFYSGISPLAQGVAEHPLRSAMHGWARSVSRPETELALLDAGKRDLPFDEGLPVPQLVAGPVAPELPAGAHVSALNDQHAFLRLPGGGDADVPVGSVVRLGLSHPCTAFDKWRLIPVIDDAGAERPRVVDFLHTFF